MLYENILWQILNRITRIVIFSVIFLSASGAYCQIEITLRKSFVDSLKNRVTINAAFEIAHAHKYANPASSDGDMHVAGIVAGVGLPVVAEVMNAKYQGSAVDLIHEKEGTGTTVRLAGVWRLWCEHAARGEFQSQGGEITIVNSNPAHVFEIHPVLTLNDIDLTGSLVPITGFKYKTADDAFARYSNTSCGIEDSGDKIKITTKGVGYNYAEFWIRITDDSQFVVADGRFVFCAVLNQGQQPVCNKMRMAFPKGSQAEQQVAKLKKGAIMHVAGIPRIDLALVSYRIKHGREKPEMLQWNLPVEMIIVAVMEQ